MTSPKQHVPFPASLLRQDLLGEAPYGAPQLDVTHQLNVNENPYPPSPAIREAMGRAISVAAGQLNRYPDREARQLREDLANYLGFQLSYEQVWPGNGSNEVLTHLLTAFGGPGRKLMTFAPSYSMYPEYARNTLTEFVAVPRRDDYQVDAVIAAEAIAQHHPDLIIIANPNNPTGTHIPVAVIAEICELFPGLVIVDEAYQEFTETPEDSAIALLPRFSNLAVSRTLSKAFALAGGRVGYLVTSPEIVSACRIVRLPYHLSTQTQVVAQVALAHRFEMMAQVEQLRADCQDLQEWCRRAGFEVIHSEANFFLFGRFHDRHSVWEHLLQHDVLVRETGPEGYLRVCVGTKEANKAFQEALGVLPLAQRVPVQGSAIGSTRQNL